MTPEELLKPRYKVIADYPNSKFYVGDVVEFDFKTKFFTGADEWQSKPMRDPNGGSGMYCIKLFEPHPHLFKKLEWWEERDEKDMPEYVKIQSINGQYKFYKVGEEIVWIIDLGQLTGIRHMGGGGTLLKYIEPATEEEYLKQNK